MKFFNPTAAVLLAAAIATTSPTALAATGENMSLNYNVVNFSATASRKVDNDQINATLTKTVQNASSSEVARQISTLLNQAVAISKKYPQVKVATGSQSTYPRYDKNQKIIGWTGNASLYLTSTDTVATSKLIAELQSFMNLDDLNFSVSDARRKQIEQELMIEASQAFQQQARTLLPVWQARDYQLVNLSFNQGNRYAPRSYAAPVMLLEKSADAQVAEQDFQAGESTLTVTADGSVQLVK